MRTLKLLLVDDHEGFINAAMRHLRRLDWIEMVGSAGNGVEAIAQCERLRPEVVLMDLAMPEMGGLQATRLIKAQDNPPYIVIASHFDDAEPAHAPLADDVIAGLLARRGVRIARRTVAKYRDQLSIPSARQRCRPAAAA